MRRWLNHWDGLPRFLDDGRIELDTNCVERGARPIVLNRKDALFAGHDHGAENWAGIASLIETCKLTGVDPQSYLNDVLTKLVNLWPTSRIDELMPGLGTRAVGQQARGLTPLPPPENQAVSKVGSEGRLRLKGVRLIISDACIGLWQRCIVGSMKKWPPHPTQRSALYSRHVKTGTPSRSEEREWAAEDDPAQKKRKESDRQALEVDGGSRQVGLNLHVGEAASHGAREPMPGLGFAMEAL
jgi:hypothetical protein